MGGVVLIGAHGAGKGKVSRSFGDQELGAQKMNQDNKDKNGKQTAQTKHIVSLAFNGLKAGCLTFVVAGVALVVGLLLDTRLGTYPRWTLILLIISAPFTLGGVYLMVRRSLKRASGEERGEANHENDLA